MKKGEITTGINLSELLDKAKQALESGLPDSYWLTAEINEIKTNTTGHCYLSLIEKEEDGEQLKAKVAATIWASAFRMIKPYFESSTGRPLSAGLKVLVKASIQFHVLYGISLNIVDIEPSYTVGSMALQRRSTIAQLQSDGVFDMNRELEFPLLPQRIAVISSEQAAGYQDFIHQLYENDESYAFAVTLFPASVQGATAVTEIIAALDAINNYQQAFDVVAIIRGGGATADLICFDDYMLAAHVAQFPLPVLTGIGHNKDESVVDMVAYQSLKTPTAVANYLIDCLSSQEVELEAFGEIIENIALAVLNKEQHTLSLLQQLIAMHSQQQLQQEKFKLQLYANDLQSYNPYSVLARGYAVVRQQGKALTNPAAIHLQEEIEITLHKGRFTIKNYNLQTE
ncbi:MAG: exodeoxyribonuclease VII large subunit [Prevotellaceae bacterium]|jgi:exodeoxyribonuclease VII large subunit|nr:exodeoxyribonuclease VII large subunit [Prevotellaceae bacterium]